MTCPRVIVDILDKSENIHCISESSPFALQQDQCVLIVSGAVQHYDTGNCTDVQIHFKVHHFPFVSKQTMYGSCLKS